MQSNTSKATPEQTAVSIPDYGIYCAICNGILYDNKGFDPFPLRESGRCCKTCYQSFVLPVRCINARKHSLDPVDVMAKIGQENAGTEPDNQMVFSLIYFKPYIHCYITKNITVCGRPIKPRGKHLSTKTVGTIENITCPECLDYLQKFMEYEAQKQN